VHFIGSVVVGVVVVVVEAEVVVVSDEMTVFAIVGTVDCVDVDKVVLFIDSVPAKLSLLIISKISKAETKF
jgi:hypothetical protein